MVTEEDKRAQRAFIQCPEIFWADLSVRGYKIRIQGSNRIGQGCRLLL